MTTTTKSTPRLRSLAAALLLGALSVGTAFAVDIVVRLSGANEVPPVTTSAQGGGTITVDLDGRVSGSVSTTGVAGTAAHIHEGAEGKNGPVIVPLMKEGDTYTVPAGHQAERSADEELYGRRAVRQRAQCSASWR